MDDGGCGKKYRKKNFACDGILLQIFLDNNNDNAFDDSTCFSQCLLIVLSDEDWKVIKPLQAINSLNKY